MPCYQCGARQSDPDGEPSPWRRAVRAGFQVLVCPDCQAMGNWEGDVDSCPSCGSSALARQLGQTVCTSCLRFVHDLGSPGEVAGVEVDDVLAREVAAAIDRALGRA